MQSDRPHQAMPALVGFSKVIRRANDSVVKNVKRFVLAKAAGVQMH
jgi:hypothetical protein